MNILKQALLTTAYLFSLAAQAQSDCQEDVGTDRSSCVENLCPKDVVMTADGLKGMVAEVSESDGLVIVRFGVEKVGYSMTDVNRLCVGK